MRHRGLVWVVIASAWLLGVAIPSAAQVTEVAARGPRFFTTSAASPTPVLVDVRQVASLRRRVSIDLPESTLAEVLSEITRQSGLRFMYSEEVVSPVMPVQLQARNMTVAATLAALLVDAGVDVMLTGTGRAILTRRVDGAAGAVQGGTVVGRATDGKSGDGIGGVDVSLEGTRWRTTTAADGRYRLTDVAPGSYTALARRIGYAPERRPVTVTTGQEATVDIALEAAATRLGDVVVTAQKREERLQDVPVSIAVVTPEEIDRRGLVSAGDYLRGIPGVNQTEVAYGGQAIIIRGLETTTSVQNFGGGPTTATYFGETQTTGSAGLLGSNVDIKLVDIERVEVLRGPQGTAFGSSSIGGAVRTIPVAPRLDRVEGKVAAGYSVTSGTGAGNYDVQGVLNVPVVKDKLALRAVGYRYEQSGFYRNLAGSDPTFQSTVVVPGGAQAFAADAEEVGTAKFTGGRIAALWQASDQLRATFSYLKQKNEVDGYPVAMSNVGPYAQTFLAVAPEHTFRGQPGGINDADIDIANAVMEYDFGWADLLATYSYIDGGSEHALPAAYVFPWPASAAQLSPHREHTGEIRLATKFDGAWNFLGGLFVEDRDDRYDSDWVWFGDAASLFGERDFLDYTQRNDLTQKAAFAEVSWKFLPRFMLTGGARAYDYDRSTQVYNRGFGAAATTTTAATDATGTNFRGNLSYKPSDDVLLYGGWTQGFRLGRAQAPIPAAACDVNPADGIVDGSNTPIASTGRVESDAVDSYELGGKFTLLERRLVMDAAVFRMDWTDLPVLVGTACGFSYTTNAGRARSEGAELQANFQLTDALRVYAGGSWIHARLTEDVPLQGWVAGNRLPGPKTNANVGLQYGFDIGGRAAFLRADAIYLGPFHSAARPLPTNRVGDYVKLDASARVEIGRSHLDLFVRNLTNEDAFVSRAPSGIADYRLRPRTIGLQLSRNF